jgi:hypothetical protein
MAKGKPFTKKQRADIIETLKPYLELDYDLKKAHTLAFSSLSEKYKKNIPDYTTISRWVKADESLAIKIEGWRNMVSAQARKNWAGKIKDTDYTASKDWLERREKNEFSTRQEMTGADGDNLIPEETKSKVDGLFGKMFK